MHRLFVILIAVLCAASPALACPCTGDDSPCTCEPTCNCQTETVTGENYGVRNTQERVIQLPQDDEKCYMTVIGYADDPAVKRLKAWFINNPDLRAVASQTHYNAIDAHSVTYTQRYASNVPRLPCIRFQAADGTTIYQVSGTDIPFSAEALANGVRTSWRRWRCQPNRGCGPLRNCCPLRDRHQDETAPPDEDPEPAPLDNSDAQPDVLPPPDPRSDFPPIGCLLGCIGVGTVIGAGGGLVKGYRIAHGSKE